jgi:hypothetical protein
VNFFLTVGAMSSALIAALQGVAAHGGLLNVPWMRLLRNPKLAGGLSAIFLNAVWLLAWIVVVAGASTGMGLLAALLRPAAAFAATIVGVSIANTPGASLFLISSGAALYFALGTAHTCRRLANSPPEALIDNYTGPNPAMGPALAVSYWKTQGTAALAAFVLTTVLVPFYRYFLDRRGILENGCVRLLLQDFNNQQIIGYCDTLCKLNSAESELSELAGSGSDAPFKSDHLRAYAIATVLIRRHGFEGARSRMVQDNIRPPRSVDRFLVGMAAYIELGGVGWTCTIADASIDGSGICARLKSGGGDGAYGSKWGPTGAWAKAGVKVTAIVAGRRFDLVVTRSHYDEKTLTLGLRAAEVAQRRALLDSLRPAPQPA